MIETGTILQDRYLIQKRIGKGGMGAVYLAVDRRFDNHVAIKETFYKDAEFGEAFEREANLLNGLMHPVLPHVSDYFSDDQGHFLVMQFIEGEDVSEVLKREGAFPVEDVLRWTDSLLDALDYLHSQEPPIIHRDLKPQNLKLTPRGDIIILDFGLAKISYEDNPGVKSIFGYSRTYSPLEQIQGTGTDIRSDLFALGATVYHLLTGQPPADAIMRASHIVAEKPDPLLPAREINTEIPSGVANVLNSALALNPDNRFVSAKAMRQAFENASDAELTGNASGATESPSKSVEASDKNNKNFSRIVNSSAFAAFVSKEVDNPPVPVEANLIRFEEFLPQDFPSESHQPRIVAAENIPSQSVQDEELMTEGVSTQEIEAREFAVEKDAPDAAAAADDKPREIVTKESPAQETAAQKISALETQKAKSSAESSSNQKLPAGRSQPPVGSFAHNSRQEAEPADIALVAANKRKPARSLLIALSILPMLFVLAAGFYLFKNNSVVQTIRTPSAGITNREVERNSARPETISEAFLPDTSESPAAEKTEEAKTRPNPAKKRIERDELAGATVNEREIKTKPEPVQNKIKPSATTAPPARSKLATRERIVSEPLPDIEAIFSGRSPSRESGENWSRTQEQRRQREKISEEQERKQRERQRERRRRNNRPLPF